MSANSISLEATRVDNILETPAILGLYFSIFSIFLESIFLRKSQIPSQNLLSIFSKAFVTKYSATTLSILFSLQEEIKNYIPNYDKEISSECNSFISDMKKKYYNENRENLKNELKTSSELNLIELQNKINKSIYWTINQIEAIINSHVQFLKNEFLDIIKILYEEKIQYLIYSENIVILNSQIEEDKLKVHKISKSFIEKINIKESIKEQNIQEGSLKKNKLYFERN